MELRQYAGLLWRWKWLLLLSTLLAAGSAFITSSLMIPVYEASTLLLINEAPDSQTSDYTALLASERLARTYAEMMANRQVLEEARSRLELGVDLRDLEKSVEVQLVRDTQLIELRVEDTNPFLSAQLANTIVEIFSEQNDAIQAGRFTASKASLGTHLDKLSEQIQANEQAIAVLGTPNTNSERKELERLQSELAQYQTSYTSLLQSYEELRMAEARTISNIVQVEPAEAPDEPVRPRVLLNTVLAGAVGAMIAVGSVFLIEYLDDTIRTPDDVERVFGAPILGYIPETKELAAAAQGQMRSKDEPPPIVTEAFRSLLTNLEFSGNLGSPRNVVVASAGSGEGKTTVASYLAATIAGGGKRAILIDADLRRPGIHKFFGVPNELGLSDMLKDDLVPQVVAKSFGNHRLKLITSGSSVDNPTELFRSVWLLKVLNVLREQADVAIFDGPPFQATEAYILASRLESVLLVIEPGRTREPVAKAIMEQLERAHANLLGVVLNRVPRSEAYTAASYLYYEYGREKPQGVSRKKAKKATSSSSRNPKGRKGKPLTLRKG